MHARSFCLFLLLTMSLQSNAQVSLLWESPSTYGDKGALYSFGGDNYPFFYVNDTVSHQLMFYSSDNFSLVYTLPNAPSQEYALYVLPDMNGNGQPEVVLMSYSYPNYGVWIKDLLTATTIYSWYEAGFSYSVWYVFKTPGSNILKIAITKRNTTSNLSTLLVYSLGVTSSSVDNSVGLPQEIKLEQSFPNPFNSATRIQYDLPTSGPISVEVFDMGGRLLRTYTLYQTAGSHELIWDGKDDKGFSVGSGAYFYRLVANGSITVKKMVLLK